MELSDLSTGERETLRSLGDDAAQATIVMEHFNALISLGICHNENGIIKLTEIGEKLLEQIAGSDSNR